jgi:hypothetical protein
MTPEIKISVDLPRGTIQKAQHDSAWKDIIDHFLPHALEICFPDLHRQIDWTREWVGLDKELQSITKETKTGQRYVDKLIRVFLKNGSEPWILIHLEVEQNPGPEFPERMFIYALRLFDKYRRPLASCALLTDNNTHCRPTSYEVGFGGSLLQQKFLLCKLIDFEKERDILESSSNPFATVILFHLDALAAKKLPQEERLRTKISLTKRLYEKGFQKQEIINLFRFLDFSIALSRPLELKYREEVHQIEAKKHMSYVSSIERISMQQGMQQGEYSLLVRLLEHKFKRVPESYRQRLKEADAETLLVWGERVLDSFSLEDVFKS